MQHKIRKLTFAFVVLLSVQGFSQTTDSKHPLLDKYYPQAKSTDTNNATTSQIKTVPEAQPVTERKPIVATQPVSATKPFVEAKPVEETKTEPAITTTTSVPVATPQSALPAIPSTTVINRPAIASPEFPAQKPTGRPATSPYRETRLGSSTKQYDTWEKNSNGAGSVTTSTK